MKVKQLIHHLSKFDPDYDVIVLDEDSSFDRARYIMVSANEKSIALVETSGADILSHDKWWKYYIPLD